MFTFAPPAWLACAIADTAVPIASRPAKAPTRRLRFIVLTSCARPDERRGLSGSPLWKRSRVVVRFTPSRDWNSHKSHKAFIHTPCHSRAKLVLHDAADRVDHRGAPII